MNDKEYMDKIKMMINPKDQTVVDREALLFKNTFTSTADGKETLAILLDMLLYNKKISLPEEIALHNTAVAILDILGLKGTDEIVNKIF